MTDSSLSPPVFAVCLFIYLVTRLDYFHEVYFLYIVKILRLFLRRHSIQCIFSHSGMAVFSRVLFDYLLHLSVKLSASVNIIYSCNTAESQLGNCSIILLFLKLSIHEMFYYF